MNSKKRFKPKKHIPIRYKYGAFIGMVLLIMSFFLTSNFWLKVPLNTGTTPTGTSLNLNSDITLTLKQWDYNPQTKSMLVEIGSSNQSIDEQVNFSYSILNNKDELVKAEVAYESTHCVFLYLYDIQDTLAIQINTSLKEDTKTTNKQVVKFLQVVEDMPQTDFSIDGMKPYEYDILDVQNDITLVEQERTQYENKISENQENIRLSKNKIATLKEEEVYMTEDEKEQNKTTIETLKTKYETYETDIENIKNQIKNCDERINKLNIKIQKYKVENGLIDAQTLKEYEQEIEQKEENINTLYEQIEQEKRVISESDLQIERLQSDSQNTENSLNQITVQLDNFQKSLNEIATREELETDENTKQELTNNKNDLSEKIAQSNAEKDRLTTQKTDLQTQLIQLNETKTDASNRLVVLQEQYDSAVNELEEYKQKVGLFS